MDKFKEHLNRCNQEINAIANQINIQNASSVNINYSSLYRELYALEQLIPDEFAIFKDRLHNSILPNLKTPDLPMITSFGAQVMAPRNGINPYALGEVTATISFLMALMDEKQTFSIWDTIHPQIITVSKKLFEDGHYANAVENAFKEVNIRVKGIYKERVGEEKDGFRLMLAAFSTQNPIIKLGDIATESGHNIQQGYMEMFAGAILGLRNPQAHSNQVISKDEAVRELNFASLLMFKIDDEIR